MEDMSYIQLNESIDESYSQYETDMTYEDSMSTISIDTSSVSSLEIYDDSHEYEEDGVCDLILMELSIRSLRKTYDKYHQFLCNIDCIDKQIVETERLGYVCDTTTDYIYQMEDHVVSILRNMNYTKYQEDIDVEWNIIFNQMLYCIDLSHVNDIVDIEYETFDDDIEYIDIAYKRFESMLNVYFQYLCSINEIQTDDLLECSICLDKIEDRQITVVCEHAFHLDCIMTWLHTSNSCPNCRHEL